MGQTEQPGTDAGKRRAAEETPKDQVWQTCGPHRFYLRDDVLFWEGHSRVTVQDLTVLFENRIALQRQHGHVFLLFNAHGINSIPPESRRYAAQFKPDPPIRGSVVVFGAGLLVRTMVSLVLGAGRLFGRRDLRTVFFVTNELEAWTLVERERLTLITTPPE